MNKREKQLLEHFRALADADADSLLAFAEFLVGRGQPVVREVPPPEPIERPAQESVVGALKRLSATYHMLDKAKMLNETSTFMAQHVIQGRGAVEVIDELELVFRRHYEAMLGDNGKG